MPDKNSSTKRYETSCPYCEKEIHVQRSLGMIAFGMDFGMGSCPFCKSMVRLNYDHDADTLVAVRDEKTDKFNKDYKSGGDTDGDV